MTMIACPKCADSVVLPERASRLATVRCPLCQEEFPLSEVLDKMPPTLIVIGDPEPAVQPFLPSGAAVPQEQAVPDFLPSEDSGGFAALSIETDSARSTTATAPGRRRPGASAKKRKPKNPLVEGAKIVLGGVAGLAIAQVILWWLGSSQSWPSQRADMFQLAPKVARFAPWAVPERYRGETTNGDASGVVAMENAEVFRQQGLPERGFVDPNAIDDLGAKPDAAAPKKPARTSPRKTPSTKLPVAGLPDAGPTGMAPVATPDLDLGQVPAMDDSSLDDLNLGIEMPPDDAPIADPVVMAVEDSEAPAAVEPKASRAPVQTASRVTAVELQSAVEAAETALEALKTADESDIQPKLRNTYVALAKLGETAALATDSESELELAGDLLAGVTAEKETLTILGRVGAVWLRPTTDRDNNGVLLVGTVKQVRGQGGYRVTELMIPGSDREILVYTSAESGEDHPVDTNLVVLGAIVSDPSRELEGYEGDASFVVWQGVAHRLDVP